MATGMDSVLGLLVAMLETSLLGSIAGGSDELDDFIGGTTGSG